MPLTFSLLFSPALLLLLLLLVEGTVAGHLPRAKVRAGTSKTTAPTDPMYADTWYLEGSVAPSINAECLWAEGLTGKGVKVLVLDDSFDFTNPELLHKEYVEASYNYMTDSKNVAPTTSEQWHGTPIAGIIAATHNNSECGVGIAPGCMLAGRVVIFEDSSVDVLCRGLSENLGAIDIISNSWGIKTCDPDDDDDDASCINAYCNLIEDVGIEQPVKNFATTGRDGKGGTVLFASGDTGENKTSDTNLNPSARIPYAITVGGVDKNLALTETSPKGKSVFITAPSADPGCKVGIVGPLSIYDDGNITHSCSETLSGSGASTPIVAGVVALMYEANSDLKGDEVRQILMHSARKIDKGDSSWTTNSAGMSHSTKYGFGFVDAAGAIEMTRKWSSCGAYQEQTVCVQTSLSSYYERFLNEGNILLPAGEAVDIPFFMKSLGSVTIDSLSVSIGNVANASIDVYLREDGRYFSTTVVSKDNTASSTQQMPFTLVVSSISDPDLEDDHEGTVTLTSYQYAGMSSSGQWTLRIKNNGNEALSMPLDSFKLLARGYPSVLELSSPIVSYENGSIKTIKVTPYLNDPGAASQDFGRGMRVYVWVDGKNPIPVTNADGTPLVVDVLEGNEISIPWKTSYNTLLSVLANSETRMLRVLFVDADEEYSPFTFNTCHTVISPIILVDVEELPPTSGGNDGQPDEEDMEEGCPPNGTPEEECCTPSPEEEGGQGTEEEPIPSVPILPPAEEEPADGFNINPVGAARIVTLLSALLIALVM